MEVILLEKMRNLGSIGDKAVVKSGYARNYLIPYGKAVAATKANIEKFDKMREELEKNAAEAFKNAQDRAAKMENVSIDIPMQATEDGKLFGSVGASTVAQSLTDAGFDIQKSEVDMPQGPIRKLGEYEVVLLLYSDVTAKIKVNVVAIKED